MEIKKFYVGCESLGKIKSYVIDAYTRHEAEIEAIHAFKSEFPMLGFYAKVKNISLAN